MTNNQKAALESAIDKLKGYWEADELSALLADGGKGEAAAPVGKVLSESEMGIAFDRSRGGNVVWFNTPQPGFIYVVPTPERAQESAGVLSDDQIREIWMRETGTTEQDSPLAILDFARAVLAKKEGA